MAGRPLFSFLGIPYAEAPVGDLRFQPPKKHPGWQVSLVNLSNYFHVFICKMYVHLSFSRVSTQH